MHSTLLATLINEIKIKILLKDFAEINRLTNTMSCYNIYMYLTLYFHIRASDTANGETKYARDSRRHVRARVVNSFSEVSVMAHFHFCASGEAKHEHVYKQ